MITFIYGPDTFRSRQKLNELVERYQEANPRGLSLRYFDLAVSRFQLIADELAVFSMFKEKKLFVLTNVFFDEENKTELKKRASDLLKTDDVLLFYEQEPIPAKDGLFKLLKDKASCFDFPRPEVQTLKRWLQKEVEKYGVAISQGAADKLIETADNDLWPMSREAQKLAAYVLSLSQQEITEQDVTTLTRPKFEAEIFKTIDALASRNKRQALWFLRQHLAKGDAPMYLLTMFNYQTRNLLVVKDLMEKQQTYQAVLQKTKLHPFVARKTWAQAQKFSFAELKKICQKLFQADIDIKTGRIDPHLALDLLVEGF